MDRSEKVIITVTQETTTSNASEGSLPYFKNLHKRQLK
jgi:hypothetical protein